MSIPDPKFNLGDMVRYIGTCIPKTKYKIIGRVYSNSLYIWHYVFDYADDDGEKMDWLDRYHYNVSYMPEYSNERYWACRDVCLELVGRVEEGRVNNDNGGLSLL